jgi:hypothetical protein
MKKLTRERVVPILSARPSWLILAITAAGFPSFPRFGQQQQLQIASARRFLARYRPLPHQK